MGNEPFRNLGSEAVGDMGLHPSVAHPIPARCGQDASVRAEATAAHWPLVSPEFSTTGQLFYLMRLCQQLSGPQSHCEVLCIGETEREVSSENRNKTGLGARGNHGGTAQHTSEYSFKEVGWGVTRM